MSNGVHEDMLAAARANLLTVAGIGGLGKAWEGFTYKPVIGTPYLRDALVPVDSVPRSNMVTDHTALYAVTLVYPSGVGTKDVGAMADAVRLAFRVGTQLFYGNTGSVTIKAIRKPVVVDPDWITVPVLITIQSFERV